MITKSGWITAPCLCHGTSCSAFSGMRRSGSAHSAFLASARWKHGKGDDVGRCPRLRPADRFGFLQYRLVQKHKSRPPQRWHRARPHFTAFEKMSFLGGTRILSTILISKLRVFKNKTYVFKYVYFHTHSTPLQNTHTNTEMYGEFHSWKCFHCESLQGV
jgi:hypothetical protein